MVLASNLSAMFDPLKIEAPESFRTDRPWGDYILWGYGMHTCFGAYINRAVMPAILKPLLLQAGPAPRAGGRRPNRLRRNAVPAAFLGGVGLRRSTALGVMRTESGMGSFVIRSGGWRARRQGPRRQRAGRRAHDVDEAVRRCR